jgi:hypothetical protein
MVCFVMFYFRRNVEIPFQGSNIFVQYQTTLPSTLFNIIEI